MSLKSITAVLIIAGGCQREKHKKQNKKEEMLEEKEGLWGGGGGDERERESVCVWGCVGERRRLILISSVDCWFNCMDWTVALILLL